MAKKTTEKMDTKSTLKSGLVTLVGRSNVGKSTLLNTLIGTKIAAVTHLPQTTRNIIHGVLNTSQGQAVFVDTPGILKARTPLTGTLVKRVKESIKDIDLILYVVDPAKSLGAEERSLLSLIRKLEAPKILVINKSDLSTKEKPFLEDYKNMTDDFDAIFEASALLGQHIEPIRQKVMELLPIGEAYYPEGQITNIEPEFWIAEIIREKIFLALRKEVPYTTHVEVTEVEEKPDIFLIKANIYTWDKKYKKMIIGQGGRALKEIGIAARKELEIALNKKIFLELEVETDKHWSERA